MPMPAPRQRRSLFVAIAAATAWIGVLCTGWYVLADYESRPGPAADVPVTWPSESAVRPASDKATLVMLAHPRCPCTRASLNELAVLATRLRGRLQTEVFFYKPEGAPDAWAHTDLWRSAERLPGVSVHVDEEGAEAARWGALVSGQTALYSPDGRLLFAGGITGARGHAGDNHGRRAVIDWVTKGRADRAQTFVFGCTLRQNTLQTTTL